MVIVYDWMGDEPSMASHHDCKATDCRLRGVGFSLFSLGLCKGKGDGRSETVGCGPVARPLFCGSLSIACKLPASFLAAPPSLIFQQLNLYL